MLKKIDESLFLILNGNHQSILDYIMIIASNLLSFVPIFLISVFIAIKYLRKYNDHQHILMNFVLILVVLVVQYLVCRYLLDGTFKTFFSRERPCSNPNISAFVRLLDKDCKATLQPFFSFKACLIFSLCTFWFLTLGKEFRAFKIILIVWSFLVAYSRIYVGAHYPLSVLVSIAIGVLLGYIISSIYYYIKHDMLVI